MCRFIKIFLLVWGGCFLIFPAVNANDKAVVELGYNALENHKAVVELGYHSLKSAILNSIDDQLNAPNDAGGLIVLLAHLDNDKVRNLLIELTHYYLGSAPGEALSYAIVAHKEKIIKKLENELVQPLMCEGNKKKCKTVEERNRKINWIIEIIIAGKTIDYVL